MYLNIKFQYLLLCGLWLFTLDLVAKTPIDIQIQGISGNIEKNVRGLLSIARQSQKKTLTPYQLTQLHQAANEDIRTALQPFGYYHPDIHSELTPPNRPDQPWTARYHIHLGQPIIIQQLDIHLSGTDEPPPTVWQTTQQQLPIKQGQILQHTDYEKSKNQLLQTLQQQGYLDAAFTRHRILINKPQHSAKIQLHLNAGARYTFGEVQFEQSLLDETLLNKYLDIDPHQSINTQTLSDLRQALSASGYFSRVGLKLDKENANQHHQVPLNISLTPAKPNRYRARLGFGTDSGLSVLLDWKRRYLNSQGHRFTLGTLATQKNNHLVTDIKYHIPLQPQQNTYLELLARQESKQLSFHNMGLSQGGETPLRHEFIELSVHHPRQWGQLTWDESLAIGYLSESYNAFDVIYGHLSSQEQTDLKIQLGGDSLNHLNPQFKSLTPSISWTIKRTNDRLYSTKGHYSKLTLSGALKGLGSNVNFFQSHLKTTDIRPFFARDRLIMRGEIGYTHVQSHHINGHTFNQLPEKFEFKTGGDTSVRGYEYQSLLSDDAITGGKHLIIGSIEYEKHLVDHWSLATFYDIGNAFNHIQQPELKAGAGMGVRWHSPVGLVRLDLAFALDEPDNPWRVHFRIGPEF